MDVKALGEGGLFELMEALALTILLGVSRWLRNRMARRRDVNHIRAILSEGQALIVDGTAVLHGLGTQGEHVVSSADAWRTMLYNATIEKLRFVLELQANLSHAQKMDVFDALDWFHMECRLAILKMAS